MKTKTAFMKEQPSGWAPDCLVWELVRKNHAYLKKAGTKKFSLESHNVLNKHSPRHTGFTHKPSVDVKLNSTGSLVVYRTRKLGNTRRPSRKTKDKNLPKSFKLLKELTATVRKDRPDLLRPLVVKFTKLARSRTDEKQES